MHAKSTPKSNTRQRAGWYGCFVPRHNQRQQGYAREPCFRLRPGPAAPRPSRPRRVWTIDIGLGLVWCCRSAPKERMLVDRRALGGRESAPFQPRPSRLPQPRLTDLFLFVFSLQGIRYGTSQDWVGVVPRACCGGGLREGAAEVCPTRDGERPYTPSVRARTRIHRSVEGEYELILIFLTEAIPKFSPDRSPGQSGVQGDKTSQTHKLRTNICCRFLT